MMLTITKISRHMIFDAIALATKSKKITQTNLDDNHYLPWEIKHHYPMWRSY